ncbi:copper amine oxidase [Massariosphaeria phaeospora]|uniref:Amine oxidase n=1 Tax=Massariosphaeria phaeospora TaxID=100035 RepID=A0A7C8MBK5_9PLEO|nr:copper amine oxidase [Massariosphaeria phaeospora]
MRNLVLSVLSFAAYCQRTSAQCSADQPTTSAPRKNVWKALSEAEYTSVAEVLIHKLNLTAVPVLSGRQNIIVQIDLLQPNKSAVLPFLAGYASEPKRYARATVQYQIPEIPYNQEYLVGPFPISNATSVQPLSYPFNNRSPGKTRMASIYAAGAGAASFLENLSSEIEDITRELWNATLAEGTVNGRVGSVLRQEDGRDITWLTFLGTPTTGLDTYTILPLGASVRLDVSSRDWREWSATGWFSDGKFYESTDAFRKAVFTSDFEKPPPNVDGPWASTDKQGEPLPLDELPPPMPVSQGAKRFLVDEKEDFVSWMDFSFYMSTSADLGLSLFDVEYKGKRILYELGLQEALAHYASSDPVISETLYFDTQNGMGAALVPLVSGYDCPSYATYLNATWSKDGGVVTVPNAICVFESDAMHPIRRHSAATYTTVTKNILFTVRTVSTVGNYDYLIEYNFFLDGAIEVSVRASGYITAAYYSGNEEYGFKIHDFLSGAMHDHVLTFKADLDILGEKNSVQKVEFVANTVEYPWAVGQPRNTMKAVKSFITNEADASIDWAYNDAALYSIVNKDTPNKFGEFPGYRVKRSAGATHLTPKDSTLAGNAAHFATSNLYVTRAKDTEPRGADRNNGFDIADPLVDFSKFLDGESLSQEDLVLWFNLGMHHMPHTGDLPNTVMTSAHSAMRLEPLNYLYGDPSVQTSQQVKIDMETGETETFGAVAANCSVELGAGLM